MCAAVVGGAHRRLVNVCFWHKADIELVHCTCPLSGVKRTCLATGLSAWSKAAVGENGAAFGLAKRNDTYFLPFVSGASKIELTASLEIRPSMR